MKGLLIKDFKLMKMQRNFFFVIVMISVGQALFSGSLSVPIGFATFVFPLFTLSTISYDEFDNGNAFLFSLGCYSGEPITLVSRRKGSFVVSVKDGRYSIDPQLAEAIQI